MVEDEAVYEKWPIVKKWHNSPASPLLQFKEQTAEQAVDTQIMLRFGLGLAHHYTNEGDFRLLQLWNVHIATMNTQPVVWVGL